ncbi:PDZ domain-containing protein [Streptomyces sp. NPDC006265]|uniref:S1C family serine protease n=1 Tax=Streptomyces sp. NPDC006265 TaxID=3156740 RepID=UPI0033AC6B60
MGRHQPRQQRGCAGRPLQPSDRYQHPRRCRPATGRGIGFAAPSSTITSIADQLIEDGKVTSSGLAALVTVRTVLKTDSSPAGAALVTVADGGPADEASLCPGDIITALGDTPITAVQTPAEALAAHSPGDKVSPTCYRAGNSHTAQLTLDTLRSP